jgi:hypothetical protein
MESRPGLQSFNVEAIKEAARRAMRGEIVPWQCDDPDGRGHEGVLRRIDNCEEAPTTTLSHELTKLGLSLCDPDALDDQQIRELLWQVIFGLASLQVFIEYTDHLTDRELYTRLWADELPEEIELDVPPDPSSAWHIDFVSSGSEESNHSWLKYYANEKSRDLWARDFPDYEIPAHEEPPYDRDRLMPAPAF